MNIGIDIDGVLCSEDLFQLVYGTKFCYQNDINCHILSLFSSERKDSLSLMTILKFYKNSHYITVIGFRAHCNLQYFLPNIIMVSSWKELEGKTER